MDSIMPRSEKSVLPTPTPETTDVVSDCKRASPLSEFGHDNHRTVSNVIPKNLNVQEGNKSTFQG
jgi:hypothetical protein